MLRGLPILMYHRVESDACPVPDPEEARYAVTLEAFTRQLDRVAEAGYRGASVGEVLGGFDRDAAASDGVAITFDDGNRSDFVHAAPLLAERGFTATFFVTGNRIGRADGLEPEMIREMSEQGMEIGGHGMTHRFLTTLNDDEHRSECADIQTKLGDITGRTTTVFAPPGGRYNRRTVDILRDLSFDAMCTSRFGTNSGSEDRFELRRLPVVRTTSDERFDAMIHDTTSKLFGDYVRASMLDMTRRVLGERVYARVRSALLGDTA